ncbi:MAG: sugar-binding domain-containing protein [Alphaproteobacteria bacterium]
MLAAGGIAKTEAIRAALRVVPARVLITDSDTAAALMAGEAPSPVSRDGPRLA